MAGLLVTLPMQAHTSVSEDNTDVGKIPVQYALSPTGAVTYQVPINVHSAPDGFQPQLSFSYNSQQNESALGLLEGCLLSTMLAVAFIMMEKLPRCLLQKIN